MPDPTESALPDVNEVHRAHCVCERGGDECAVCKYAADLSPLLDRREAGLRDRLAAAEGLVCDGQWIRHEGRTYLKVRMPDGADLSCEAMRSKAFNEAIAAHLAGPHEPAPCGEPNLLPCGCVRADDGSYHRHFEGVEHA